jgi:hypothetical protein
MTAHPIQLHLRARHLTRVAGVLPVLAVLTGWVAHLLITWPGHGGAAARPPVTTMAPLVVVLLLGMTLAGADVELDRSQPRLSNGLRAIHALSAAAVGSSLLALSVTQQPQLFGALALARNTLGLLGVVLLASALLSPQLIWVPAFGYAAAVHVGAPYPAGSGAAWWAWVMQPGRLDPAWIVAIALLVAGTIVYTVRGPAR